MATGKILNVEIEGNDVLAKSSENYASVEIRCINSIVSYKFLNARLGETPTKVSNAPISDAKKKQKIIAYRHENLVIN